MKRKSCNPWIAFSLLLLACSLLLPSGLLAQKRPTKLPDIHFVPTPHEVVEIMLRLADVKKSDVVYDLGCGDGRIVIAAAKKTGARAIGFDIDPERVKESKDNVKSAGVGHLVTIKEQDIFELDLSGASVITLYLLPELNVRLIPQLEKLKPGTRIVSHAFDMQGVQPDVEATVYTSQGLPIPVFLWTTPLKKK
jgi:precorrin-6B methylase 2